MVLYWEMRNMRLRSSDPSTLARSTHHVLGSILNMVKYYIAPR